MKLQGVLQAEGLVTHVADVLVVYVRLWDTMTIHEGHVSVCVCVCVCVRACAYHVLAVLVGDVLLQALLAAEQLVTLVTLVEFVTWGEAAEWVLLYRRTARTDP